MDPLTHKKWNRQQADAYALTDRHVFDVSLAAGHRDYLGRRSDFPPAFIRQLTYAAREAKGIVRSFRLTPPGRLHFTLRAVYGDRSPAFPRRTDLQTRQQRYAQIQKWVNSDGTGRVLWEGLALTPSGVLILKGRAIGGWLLRLRRKIDRTADQRSLYPASSFCHIVLGRPSRLLSGQEQSRLQQWLQNKSNLMRRPMWIKQPILVVTRNHFGTQYHTTGRAEVGSLAGSPRRIHLRRKAW